MGIFGFFKQKKTEPANEKISIKEISSFIKNKKQFNELKEKDMINEIITNINSLVLDLNEKIKVLNCLDLNQKKVDARTRFVVNENLNHYIGHVTRLIVNLQEVKRDSLDSLIKSIDSEIIDFENRSKINYEKATFIIGKEIAGIKDAITGFLRNTRLLISQNKNFMDNLIAVSYISEKLQQMNEIERSFESLEIEKDKENKELKFFNESIEKSNQDILNLEKSEKFLEEERKIEELKNQNYELERKIFELKEMIDFKKLSSIYHYDSKKMALINMHKMNFVKSIQLDHGASIIRLVEEAHQNDVFVLKKLTEIRNKLKELSKESYESKNFPEHELMAELRKKESYELGKQKELEDEIEKNSKVGEKLMQKKQEIINEIKTELAKINIELRE